MEYIEQASHLIIRPSRQNYCIYDIGPTLLNNKTKRIDFKVVNNRNLVLQASLFIPINPIKQCVIYCHSSNGSRLEALTYSQHITNESKYFCTFDFSGCGISQGQYISLGYHQSQDLFVIIKHIKQKYCIEEYSLWGRSMGCMSILLFLSKLNKNMYNSYGLQKYIKINSIVLDSPYCNLYNLILQLGEVQSGIPTYLLKMVFVFIKKTIQQKVNFSIDELNAETLINTFKIPMLILCSKKDLIVKNKHSEYIYQNYQHPEKTLYYFDCNHHEQRSIGTNNQIYKFIHTYFRKSQAEEFHLKRKLSNDVINRKSVPKSEKQNFLNTNFYQRKTLDVLKEKKLQRNIQQRGISSILCQKK